MITKINSTFRKFHSDEDGLEALQVVMIIAVAGMIMVAASVVGQAAVTWMKEKWESLKGTSIA